MPALPSVAAFWRCALSLCSSWLRWMRYQNRSAGSSSTLVCAGRVAAIGEALAAQLRVQVGDPLDQGRQGDVTAAKASVLRPIRPAR